MAGCHADRVSKVFGEVTLAIEATLQGNLGDRPCLAFQQLLSLLNALLS